LIRHRALMMETLGSCMWRLRNRSFPLGYWSSRRITHTLSLSPSFRACGLPAPFEYLGWTEQCPRGADRAGLSLCVRLFRSSPIHPTFSRNYTSYLLGGSCMNRSGAGVKSCALPWMAVMAVVTTERQSPQRETVSFPLELGPFPLSPVMLHMNPDNDSGW